MALRSYNVKEWKQHNPKKQTSKIWRLVPALWGGLWQVLVSSCVYVTTAQKCVPLGVFTAHLEGQVLHHGGRDLEAECLVCREVTWAALCWKECGIRTTLTLCPKLRSLEAAV